MNNDNKLEQGVQTCTTTVANVFKNSIFDFIAVGILIAMLALNLGVIELRDTTLLNVVNILLECIPFFITSVLLSINFYHKGTHTGKSTANFIAISKSYSDIVTALTGQELNLLPDFCAYYNESTLKQLQTNMLRGAAITYEEFNEQHTAKDNTIIPALKVLSKRELLSMYSKERVNIILKAKRIKIKGINENLLLGNNNLEDGTDMGDDEKTMDKQNTFSSATIYLISTLFLSLIGIRDILEWGWVGLLITVFKLTYVLCSSYMKHFKGYNNITVNLANHIARKTDVLKQFKHWSSLQLNTDGNN